MKLWNRSSNVILKKIFDFGTNLKSYKLSQIHKSFLLLFCFLSWRMRLQIMTCSFKGTFCFTDKTCINPKLQSFLILQIITCTAKCPTDFPSFCFSMTQLPNHCKLFTRSPTILVNFCDLEVSFCAFIHNMIFFLLTLHTESPIMYLHRINLIHFFVKGGGYLTLGNIQG